LEGYGGQSDAFLIVSTFFDAGKKTEKISEDVSSSQGGGRWAWNEANRPVCTTRKKVGYNWR